MKYIIIGQDYSCSNSENPIFSTIKECIDDVTVLKEVISEVLYDESIIEELKEENIGKLTSILRQTDVGRFLENHDLEEDFIEIKAIYNENFKPIFLTNGFEIRNTLNSQKPFIKIPMIE
jgi:hypothetical protein